MHTLQSLWVSLLVPLGGNNVFSEARRDLVGPNSLMESQPLLKEEKWTLGSYEAGDRWVPRVNS